MSHSLALIAVAIISSWVGKTQILKMSGFAFVLGILLFSGSLYLLVLLDQSALGIITPFGGICFLVGWILFVWGVAKAKFTSPQ